MKWGTLTESLRGWQGSFATWDLLTTRRISKRMLKNQSWRFQTVPRSNQNYIYMKKNRFQMINKNAMKQKRVHKLCKSERIPPPTPSPRPPKESLRSPWGNGNDHLQEGNLKEASRNHREKSLSKWERDSLQESQAPPFHYSDEIAAQDMETTTRVLIICQQGKVEFQAVIRSRQTPTETQSNHSDVTYLLVDAVLTSSSPA